MNTPHFHIGSTHTEMDRETWIFPYGESPFPNRVCFHLGINIYIKANKSMYRLPHAGLLANKQLEKRLIKHGYQPRKLVTGLRKHDTRPIYFTLVVDNFGMKYTRQEI